MIEVVPARVKDIGPVATRAREIDRVECEASGMTPKTAMRYGMRHGVAFSVLDDGVPVAMFGAVPRSLLTGSASVWLIATDAALDHPREWLSLGRLWAAAILAEYPHAQNRVHKDNRAAIRWLERIGFTVDPPVGDSLFRDFAACATQQQL